MLVERMAKKQGFYNFNLIPSEESFQVFSSCSPLVSPSNSPLPVPLDNLEMPRFNLGRRNKADKGASRQEEGFLDAFAFMKTTTVKVICLLILKST